MNNKTSTAQQVPLEVFKSYQNLGQPLSIEAIEKGLINKTYLVTTDQRKFILQELSSIFDPVVMDDSEAVATHLNRHEIIAPKIYRTDKNNLFTVVDGKVFRALIFIDGITTHTITSLKMAYSAGQILGKFHCALRDFDYEYKSKRHHGGDYQFHAAHLTKALRDFAHHDYFSTVLPLATSMLKSLNDVTNDLFTTPRHAHGDPKISNIIFNTDDEAICLIDFDTLGMTGWSLEMGDALRSWCNPQAEDVLDAQVDLNIAEHSLKGYGAHLRGYFTKKEAHELVTHAQAITLCLAIRFLTDVFYETYWAYDQNRFSRPSQHNWLRAQAMHHLFSDFFKKRSILFDMTESYLF